MTDSPNTLVGYWGLSFTPDGDMLHQFEVIRVIESGQYAVQLFSWWDGCPTCLEILTAEVLCGDSVKLYRDRDAMVEAADRETAKTQRRRA